MEMQCDLLISNFKNTKTIALMKGTIEHISDGSSPHCGGALKLGFKKAFELKKQERGVRLQCSNPSCEWNQSPALYSSVGANTYCPRCPVRRSRYYMLCAGCGTRRTSGYAELCEGCGKRFL